MQYSCHGKKGTCYFFYFCCVLLFYFFRYVSLYCNLIKLLNVLRKYAANEQKRF